MVFVDTNVLIYAVDITEPAKRSQARAWMTRLWRSRAGRTGVQVLSEYYAVLTRVRPSGALMTAAAAQRRVERLFSWQPTPVNIPLVRQAMVVQDRFAFSWWDSLIVAAAQVQSCDYLLTEDLQDGQRLDSLQIVNPFAHQPADFV